MQIKVRVPIKCNNCGFKSFQYFEWNGQQFIECGYEKCGCVNPAFEIVGEPQQLTGLHDKKGKEIYKGDILKSNSSGLVYPVCYDVNHAGFVTIANRAELSPNNWKHSQIIGNIHENPELSK